MASSFSRQTAVGFFVAVGLVCVGYLTVKLGRMELSASNTYSVYAAFDSVTGLRTGAEVVISGVRVGRVAKISLDSNGPRAKVELQIDKSIELSDDTIASVKTSGLIGDRYISLQPGGIGSPLKAGDEITDTESAVDIETLISKYVFGKV
ncbi:MAG: outer membrane lipid asymmetry maintenance protein MlaD [Desulfovibrionaceae bacterium]|nr:outer membrane lipid asymmetry maintenance protein MlaD [Desulfovibrionaceae bacterium]